MNDWHNFFNRVDDNLADSTYRIFEDQSKTELLHWFSREDVGKEQKEDFIQALVDFKDDCGDFYRYRAYLLAAEAINYFKDCSRGDAIALQILINVVCLNKAILGFTELYMPVILILSISY